MEKHLQTEQATSVIAAMTPCSYLPRLSYFLDIAPIDHADYIRRWLFAYATIRNGWQQSLRLYQELEDLAWVDDKDKLRAAIVRGKAGFHNVRVRYIWDFIEKFRSDPDTFFPAEGETWVSFRNRLVGSTLGIGLAKVSFTLEMTWPEQCRVVCLDAHMLRLYGESPNQSLRQADYEKVEAHWVAESVKRGMAPAIARAVYWDSVQSQNNSHYWGKVFHGRTEAKEFDGGAPGPAPRAPVWAVQATAGDDHQLYDVRGPVPHAHVYRDARPHLQ
jgi:thermostable 8-oxoguanine DNA glycosylase